MALPRNEQGPQHLRSMPSDNLHLQNSFEDTGVSGQHVLDLLTLESVVFQRYLSAQRAPTVLQRFNRGEGALLLRDLAAAAALPPALPPHSAPFFQQLLGLTHRWWSEAEGPEIEVNVLHPCRSGLHLH